MNSDDATAHAAGPQVLDPSPCAAVGTLDADVPVSDVSTESDASTDASASSPSTVQAAPAASEVQETDLSAHQAPANRAATDDPSHFASVAASSADATLVFERPASDAQLGPAAVGAVAPLAADEQTGPLGVGDGPFEGEVAADDLADEDPADEDPVDEDPADEDPADEDPDDGAPDEALASYDEPEFDETESDGSPFGAANLASHDVRSRLVRQFETWLDRMADGEPPPEGLPEELLADALEAPEPSESLGADLYAVFAGLTKLSGEVGLQGRAFKQLADALAPSALVPGRLERVESALNAVARELARRSEPAESDLPASEDILSVLFDLYDRLSRGLKTLETGPENAPPPAGPNGFLRRLFGCGPQTDPLAAPAAAMKEGYRLTLSRLEASFLQWGIGRIGEVGEQFDPQRMAVVEVASASGAPEGSVLEVYRSGYVLNGRVLATARVKVAKSGV